MTLTAEQEREVLDRVAADLADRTWERLESELAELQLITIPRLAGMLDLSTARTREIVGEVVTLGPGTVRVSLSEARRVVDARTTRS